MYNLFILVLFVYVVGVCNTQEYDDVDYYLKDENPVSVESSQVDSSYNKVENEAKTVLNNVKDKSELLKKSLKSKKVTTEKSVDLSSEIETMINEIRHSVGGSKKHEHVTPCPPGHHPKYTSTEEAKRSKLTDNPEQIKTNKNDDSYETQTHSKNINHHRHEYYAKSKEVNVAKSNHHVEVTKQPEISDFYERDEYYTTEKAEHKSVKHNQHYESYEESQEHKSKKHSGNHLNNEEHKIKDAKLSQKNQPCDGKHHKNKPCNKCKEKDHNISHQDSEEIITSKSRKSINEDYKSAEEEIATICETCKKYAQVEPYVNPKKIKQAKSSRKQLDVESDEEEKSFESKTSDYDNIKHNRITRSPKTYEHSHDIKMINKHNHEYNHTNNNKHSKHYNNIIKSDENGHGHDCKHSHDNENDHTIEHSHEEVDQSDENKFVQLSKQNNVQIGRRGKTNYIERDERPRKHNHKQSKTVEIEISKSSPCNHKESSEEQESEKPCRHAVPRVIVTKGKVNKTEKIEVKPKRPRRVDVSAEISETQKDHVEHIRHSDDDTQNATVNGESKNKDETTTEVEKKTKTVVSYPFSISIQKKGAHYATGALLDKNWILTVAGEFYNVRESIKLYKARLGSVNCKRGGLIIALKRIEIHPRFSYKSPNYDIALIMVAKPVVFTDMIKPIGLSSVKTKVISAKFMTTYWSRVIIKGQVLPMTANERIKQTSLRVSTQKLIPWDLCDTLMEMGNATLDSSTLCLRPIESHHSLCTPDAGAPVVAEDGLWGITSGWTSRNCPSNPSPTVFTRVSSPVVRSWLDSIMHIVRKD